MTDTVEVADCFAFDNALKFTISESNGLQQKFTLNTYKFNTMLTFRLSILFIFFVQPISAQTLTEVPVGPPFEDVQQGDMAFADIDNDGDQDLMIIGRRNTTISTTLYVNDGAGQYIEVSETPFDQVWLGAIAFADVDGDNDQDVLITGLSNVSELIAKLYLNDGTGTFTEAMNTPFEGVNFSAIAFADIDGDNDQDVLITGTTAGESSIADLYLNNGSGIFSLVSDTPFEAVEAGSIAFANVNDDDLIDVLIAGNAGGLDGRITNLYINDGTGDFFEIQNTPFEGIGDGSIAFSDVDGDDDQDVLITGKNNSFNNIAKLYENDGFGSFAEVTGTPFEGVNFSAIAFVDSDSDNDMDVLITGQGNNDRISSLYVNNGDGIFSIAENTPFDPVVFGDVAIADIDGDNHSDILISGLNFSSSPVASTLLYTNDGTGQFTKRDGTSFEGVYFSSLAYVDIDGDDDQDVFITGINREDDPTSVLYTNDGSGDFSEIPSIFPALSFSEIAFADVDGDDDQDVLIIGEDDFSNDARLYLNNGSGFFSVVFDTPFERVDEGAIAFSDIDQDNDQDVLITGYDNLNNAVAHLYVNNGSGSFSEVSSVPFEGVSFSAVAFADVDGDNDQDVLISGQNNQFLPTTNLYLNDGSGVFTIDASANFEDLGFGSIAFADIENDGDQDVVITGIDNLGGDITKLYANNGSGSFTEINTPFEGVHDSSISFEDVDGDNDQDLLITGFSTTAGHISKLYINDGSGNFTELPGTPFEQVRQGSIAFADVDGDNDPDLLITGQNDSFERIARLYINEGATSSSRELITESSLRITLFPNPAPNDKLNVRFESEKSGFAIIQIYSLSGHLMSQHQTRVSKGTIGLGIDISSLAPGSYFIEINDGKNRGTSRFIIQ
ncbi:MAG: T9SS type A sorting domain-containing protein [Bacteroidota bacterium]